MKITYVSSCLLKKSNKVLITSRPKGKFLSGFWEIPGGKLFNNESFEDCAVRELYEEIGVSINKEDLKNIDLVKRLCKNCNKMSKHRTLECKFKAVAAHKAMKWG